MGEKNRSKMLSKILSREGFYVILFLCLCTVAVAAVYLSVSSNNKNQTQSQKDKPTIVSKTDQELGAEDKILSNNNLGSSVKPPVKQKIKEVKSTNKIKAVKGIKYERTEKKNLKKSTEKISGISFMYPVEGEIVKPYDATKLQESKTLQQWETHEGIDIACDIATEVKAVADGKVIEIINDDKMMNIEKTGLGVTVKIEHADGVFSIYSNLAEEVKVKKGDTVKKGTVLGVVGDTAIRETSSIEGSHIHFAVMKKIDNEFKLVNPRDYFKK